MSKVFASILIYITSNSHTEFDNLFAGMLIFKQFKTIPKRIFYFLLVFQFVFKGIVTKMLNETAA